MMASLIGAAIVGAGLTLLLSVVMLRWAPRLGLTDAPGGRKPHTARTPVGGAAVVLGSMAGALVFIAPAPEIVGWLLGALLVGLMGTIDDLRGLRPHVKLAGQLTAALFPVIMGDFVISSVELFGVVIDLGPFAVPLTLLWLVGITNGVNLIDGLDGLAVGATLVAAGVSALLAAQTGNGEVLALSLALLGAVAAFLRFNSHPARLFLGDGGSYFLGFTLAWLTVGALSPDVRELRSVPVLVPVALLGYPIIDTLWAIVRRARAGRPIFAPDMEHLHHRLQERFGDVRRTVRLFYGLFLGSAALALLLWALARGSGSAPPP